MILGEMKREANKYREAHQSAQDNNTALHKAIMTHMANLQTLSKPLDQIVASIPSLAEAEGMLHLNKLCCFRLVLFLLSVATRPKHGRIAVIFEIQFPSESHLNRNILSVKVAFSREDIY